MYLRDDPVLGTQLQNHCELRVPSAERAAYYLDCALAARSDDPVQESHLFFTLHVYQYSVAGKGGGEYAALHIHSSRPCRGRVSLRDRRTPTTDRVFKMKLLHYRRFDAGYSLAKSCE